MACCLAWWKMKTQFYDVSWQWVIRESSVAWFFRHSNLTKIVFPVKHFLFLEGSQ